MGSALATCKLNSEEAPLSLSGGASSFVCRIEGTHVERKHMKLLFLSCHSIEEFDKIRMFSDMGIDVYSMHGAYASASTTSEDADLDLKRPGIPGIREHHRLNELALQCTKEHIHPEIISWADSIYFMHQPHLIQSNWDEMRRQSKPVIYGSIGQSNPNIEAFLAFTRATGGLYINRYSPRESAVPNYAGHDAQIRFNKRPEEWGPWTGLASNEVVNFTQNAKNRGTHCGYGLMEQIHAKIPTFKLYGPENNNSPFDGGLVSSARQREILRNARCYFTPGTHPASYVLNFMEAWMTGTPMVVAGPTWGNPHKSGAQWDSYEMHELVEHGVSGLVADSPAEMVDAINSVLTDDALASKLSENGRKRAIELFAEAIIAPQWKAFLDGLV